MINDPNKPIIDVRTSSLDGQEAPAYTGLTPGESLKAATPATENAKPVSIGTQSPQAGAAQSPSETSESSETASSSRSTLMTTVPDQFNGTTNDELIAYLEKKIAEHKPLTDEDVKKIRRRQRAEGIISGIADAAQSVANLFYTTQYAPNMYNADEGMSARAKARFEKEKADREADDDRYFNYAMNLAKLKEADQQKGLNVWQLEQNLARQDRAYEDGRKDRDDDKAFRDKDFDERVRQWWAGFDRDGKRQDEESRRWDLQFQESTREFNVSSANERARINMEGQRLAKSLKEGQMTFNLGSGNGNVTLTLDKLNAQTVSRIFNTLPEAARAKVKGDPIVQNGFVVDHKPPTTEAMLIAIGANVETSPATQNAIKQVAGIEKGDKPKGY